MPPAAVYFVKFSSKARMAACLMLSGVAKSGSPAPKATTSTPSALSFAALALTAIVADSLMREIRFVSSIRCSGFSSLLLEALFDNRRDQLVNVSAEPPDLFDKP